MLISKIIAFCSPVTGAHAFKFTQPVEQRPKQHLLKVIVISNKIWISITYDRRSWAHFIIPSI